MALVLQAAPATAQAFFRSPPTEVSIHNPAPMEGQRNRTTISVRVPETAGADLQQVVLSQLANLDQWSWGRKQPESISGPMACDDAVKPGWRMQRSQGMAMVTITLETGNPARRASEHCLPWLQPGRGDLSVGDPFRSGWSRPTFQ